jgi:hypothetical protein
MATLFDPRSIGLNSIPANRLINNSITAQQLASNSVTQNAIRLDNNSYLRARNAADSADVNIVKVNSSDKIEFASIPSATGTPSDPTDLVNLSFVQTLLQGLKPKEPVRVATTENIDINTGGLLTVDGIIVASGDRVLVKDQTNSYENGIYVASSGQWIRATDADTGSKLTHAYTIVREGTINGQKGFVEQLLVSNINTDPVTFVQFSVASAMIGGDMITVTGQTISVDLAPTSGLESTNPGNDAGQLRIKLEATNPTLQIDGSNQLGAKLDTAGAITTGTAGLKVNLESSNPSLQIASNELGIKFDAAGGLSKGAAGTKVNTDATTVKVNSGNQLEGLKTIEELITLTTDNVNNKYVDLSYSAYGTSPVVNSVSVDLVGFPKQQKVIDYSVSLTGGNGGVTRINWAGLGLDNFVIAGDKLIVTYSYL